MVFSTLCHSLPGIRFLQILVLQASMRVGKCFCSREVQQLLWCIECLQPWSHQSCQIWAREEGHNNSLRRQVWQLVQNLSRSWSFSLHFRLFCQNLLLWICCPLAGLQVSILCSPFANFMEVQEPLDARHIHLVHGFSNSLSHTHGGEITSNKHYNIWA